MYLSFVTRSNAGARLTEVANTAANGEQIGVRYTLALDDQRTEAGEESGAKWQYGYDRLKQLVTAKFRGQGPTRPIRFAESDQTDTQATVIPPLDQSYAYDPMGNRRTYADQAGSTAHTTNNANQYTLTVSTINGQPSTDNCAYDKNGNLLSDGVRAYTWDAENQLTSVSPVNPTEGSAKVEHTYDWRMRRTGKKSYTYTAGNWTLSKTTGFKYHEWNPIQETIVAGDLATPNSPLTATTKSYVWGNDLSGNLHGASGVGGLLSMKYNGENYFYAFDGNGNVRALVKAEAVTPANSGITARYAYDGFGKEVAVGGADAGVNAFRFSTKQLDAESGMSYYGYRYYVAGNGRWINRDPIAELGGLSLYAMVDNDLLLYYDYYGLKNDCNTFSTSISLSNDGKKVGPISTPVGPFTFYAKWAGQLKVKYTICETCCGQTKSVEGSLDGKAEAGLARGIYISEKLSDKVSISGHAGVKASIGTAIGVAGAYKEKCKNGRIESETTVSPETITPVTAAVSGGVQLQVKYKGDWGNWSGDLASAELFENATFGVKIHALKCDSGGCTFGGADASLTGTSVGIRACALGGCFEHKFGEVKL